MNEKKATKHLTNNNNSNETQAQNKSAINIHAQEQQHTASGDWKQKRK